MSNTLTDARDQLVTLLKDAGLHAFATAPQQVTPPFVYVGANDPYLDWEGASFGGTVFVRFQVGVVAAPAKAGPVNDVVAAKLDDLVLQVIATLSRTDYVVESVDEPGLISVAGSSLPAAPLNVRIEIRL